MIQKRMKKKKLKTLKIKLKYGQQNYHMKMMKMAQVGISMVKITSSNIKKTF